MKTILTPDTPLDPEDVSTIKTVVREAVREEMAVMVSHDPYPELLTLEESARLLRIKPSWLRNNPDAIPGRIKNWWSSQI